MRALLVAAALIGELSQPGPAGRVTDVALGQGFAGVILLSEAGQVTLERGFGSRVPQPSTAARTLSDFRADDRWYSGGQHGTLRQLWRHDQALLDRGAVAGAVSVRLPGCTQPQQVVVRRERSGQVHHFLLPAHNMVLILATSRPDMAPGDIGDPGALAAHMLAAAACRGDA